MIRWNFRGFFYFFSCIDLIRLRIQVSRSRNRSAAIFRETRNGVGPISGAQNEATAMAFGGPRSSCVRPGAHSARHQDSAMTGRRVAWLGLSSPPALTRRTPTKRSALRLRLRGGRRTPLVAYAPSLSWAPPRYLNSCIPKYPTQPRKYSFSPWIIWYIDSGLFLRVSSRTRSLEPALCLGAYPDLSSQDLKSQSNYSAAPIGALGVAPGRLGRAS